MNQLWLIVFLSSLFVANSGYTISTIAGTGATGNIGNIGDGGSSTNCKVNNPRGLYQDSSANVYIADTGHLTVRKINVATGVISSVAGTGAKSTQGTSANGDGGSPTSATFNGLYDIYLDSSSNIYIADRGNNKIRKVTASTGLISTIAGDGTTGYGGDGTSATSAILRQPSAVIVDSSNNVYIPDYDNSRIRKITASTGYISTIIGTGSAAFFGDTGQATSAAINKPRDVSISSSGDIYFADTSNNRIRKVSASTGIINTIAGSDSTGSYSGDGGQATSATLYWPCDVALDSTGNIYIADTKNNRIRYVSISTGIITTIAGTGSTTYNNDAIDGTSANLNNPEGITVDSSGNVYISDTTNNRVRKLTYFTSATTVQPSTQPSLQPSSIPSGYSTLQPSYLPSTAPSQEPTIEPSTLIPTVNPTTLRPSYVPSTAPSQEPTIEPSTLIPTVNPTRLQPSNLPTVLSSENPTEAPTYLPTAEPSLIPTESPSTIVPSAEPSRSPTDIPTVTLTYLPTAEPSLIPTESPSTAIPTFAPSFAPTYLPSLKTDSPTTFPSTTKPTSVLTPSPKPTYSPTKAGESIMYFEVGQIISGVSLSQWNSDSNCKVVFKMTLSYVAGIDMNNILNLNAANSSLSSLLSLSSMSLRRRRLDSASLYLTYDIYYIEDISSSTDAMYDEITGKLYASLVNGEFTATLQETALEYGVASMYNVSSNTTGLNTTEPRVMSRSSYDTPSDSNIAFTPIIVGITGAVIITICMGSVYYYYEDKKTKKKQKLMNKELGIDVISSVSDIGTMYSSGRSSDTAMFSSDVGANITVNPMINGATKSSVASPISLTNHSTSDPMLDAIVSTTKVKIVKKNVTRNPLSHNKVDPNIVRRSLSHHSEDSAPVADAHEQEDVAAIQSYLLQHCGVSEHVTMLLAKSLVKTYHLNSVSKLCSSHKSQELQRILESHKPYVTDNDVFSVSSHFASITGSEAETGYLLAANALPPIIPNIDESEPTTPDNSKDNFSVPTSHKPYVTDNNVPSVSRFFASITGSEAETGYLLATNALPPIIPKIDESEPTTPDNSNFKSALHAWKKRQSVIIVSPMSPN